jgi:nucleoside-diphosphate-sugar epimerase
MRILIIGGTRFVGRALTQAALDGGHDVTLLHRGQTGPGLFPQATHVIADRNADLAAVPELAAGQWDATIDVNAYVPRQVIALADALGGRGGRYLYISSVSVYQPPVKSGYGEDAPLAELADPTTEDVNEETYGGLKVLCERAATARFGADGTTIIRPTYVIGPHDYSYRFTWWVDRIARGGEVLAPGDPADPIQVIDARDMATWTIGLAQRSVSGTFHAVSPAPPFGFGAMLETIASVVAPPGTRLTWVDNDFLTAAGVPQEALPLWAAGDPDGELSAASPAAAEAAGLRPRPLADSVADIHAAQATDPVEPRPGTGLPAGQEADLLARWAAR